jgi:dTMP kinase
MHLAAQDRLRHTMEEILPALLSGRDVLCDRFTLSSLAYFSARGIEDVGAVEAANRFAPTPDLLIYLDLEPEVALVRVVNRDGRSEKLEEQDLQVMRKVRAAYRSWFPVVPARNRVLIDAAGSRDEVTRAAVDSLRFCSPLA